MRELIKKIISEEIDFSDTELAFSIIDDFTVDYVWLEDINNECVLDEGSLWLINPKTTKWVYVLGSTKRGGERTHLFIHHSLINELTTFMGADEETSFQLCSKWFGQKTNMDIDKLKIRIMKIDLKEASEEIVEKGIEIDIY